MKNLLMVRNCTCVCLCVYMHEISSTCMTGIVIWLYIILHYYIDDPESRMLYEHHGENEMMTSFINVRSITLAT